jgi:alkylated DNA repair dioxygenase AlkB
MASMFSNLTNSKLQELPIGDGCLHYAQQFLPQNQADTLLTELIADVPWQQAEIRLFGKKVLTPRLSCWMGDASAVYRYSNTIFLPEPWLSSILALKNQLETVAGSSFNSVLLNYYRNGQDAMGWHSDDEPELGQQPVIASVSIGAERRFLLRKKTKNARSIGLPLAHGSLLLMQGDSQRKFQHALPRTALEKNARINLTFRKIL